MKILSKLMSMDERTWRRHSSPYSVWTRVLTGLPLILFSVWLIKPLGTNSLFVIIPSFFWMWLNPRLFSEPKDTNNWASKITFGERIWLNRDTCPIPKHHENWALFLSIVSGVGFIIALVGSYQNFLFPTIVGGVISWFGKMWFCDRMVWLFEDMKGVKDEEL